MPLKIVRNDITLMHVDAIVNAANTTLMGGGGVDGAIHRAAGPELKEECRTIGGCAPGQAVLTRAYRLPARFVIHTVGPIWYGGKYHEKETLASCYTQSLKLALENGCESIAFPAISTGAYGYPAEEALRVATAAISDFLVQNDMNVFLVVFSGETFGFSHTLQREIQSFIGDAYAEARAESSTVRMTRQQYDETLLADLEKGDAAPADAPFPAPRANIPGPSRRPERSAPETGNAVPRAKPALSGPAIREARTAPGNADLEQLLKQRDEGFSEMLLRKIDERGMSDSTCYKKANIDRKLFSKIRSNPAYRPGKNTVLAFAVALEMDMQETNELLRAAGYALTRSRVADIIVEYFIRSRNYDIYLINEALFQYDQPLLGN